MILVEEITKTFKKDFWAKPIDALRDVSFEIGEGQVVGFLGANGAGKTTTMKILFNFIKPDKGQVKFSGCLGKNLKEALSKIGYLPERPYFYPHLTGEEFVLYMASLNGVSRTKTLQKLRGLAERFKIDHALNRQIKGYSKGMLQRVGFVSILIHEPDCLILDEPLSGLDPVGRKELKDVLRELSQSGKTIFFSSHIVSDIEEVCENVVVLEQGKLLYQGEINQLIRTNSANLVEITLAKELQHFDETWGTYCGVRAGGHVYQVADQKMNLLAEALKNKIEVHKVQPVQPTLEEIVYKIRS